MILASPVISAGETDGLGIESESQAELEQVLSGGEVEQLLDSCLYFIGVTLSQCVRKEQFAEHLKRPLSLV